MKHFCIGSKIVLKIKTGDFNRCQRAVRFTIVTVCMAYLTEDVGERKPLAEFSYIEFSYYIVGIIHT